MKNYLLSLISYLFIFQQFLLADIINSYETKVTDYFPKSINGEFGMTAQYRTLTGAYYNLNYAKDYYFNKPDNSLGVPIVCLNGTNLDTLYLHPSAKMMALYDRPEVRTALLNIKLDGGFDTLQLKGTCRTTDVGHVHFSIYLGDSNYINPIWKSDNDSNSFDLIIPYKNNDPLYLAVDPFSNDYDLYESTEWTNVKIKGFGKIDTITHSKVDSIIRIDTIITTKVDSIIRIDSVITTKIDSIRSFKRDSMIVLKVDTTITIKVDTIVTLKGKYTLNILIPDTTAIVGTKNFHIPILIKSNIANQILSMKKYSTEILINKYCFLPEHTVTGTFNTYYDGENSVIKIDGIVDNYNSGYKIINEIVGTVLMGDSINPIIIKTFDFEDKGLIIDTIKDGTLKLKACANKFSKIQIFQVPEINIIPNPVNDYSEIQFMNFEDYQYNIAMYNILGNKLFTKEINPNKENFILNFNQYNSGIYFIAVTLNNKMIINKLLIK